MMTGQNRPTDCCKLFILLRLGFGGGAATPLRMHVAQHVRTGRTDGTDRAGLTACTVRISESPVTRRMHAMPPFMGPASSERPHIGWQERPILRGQNGIGLALNPRGERGGGGSHRYGTNGDVLGNDESGVRRRLCRRRAEPTRAEPRGLSAPRRGGPPDVQPVVRPGHRPSPPARYTTHYSRGLRLPEFVAQHVGLLLRGRGRVLPGALLRPSGRRDEADELCGPPFRVVPDWHELPIERWNESPVVAVGGGGRHDITPLSV